MHKLSEKNHWIKMFVIASVDAVLAGFYLRIFPLDYTINLAVAILPIYYYFDHQINPIKTAMWIASVGLIFRTLTGVYFYGSFQLAFWTDFPFLYFDMLYGVVFFLAFYKAKEKNIYKLFFAALLGDFCGNALEFVSRFGLATYFSNNVMGTLLVVAIVRAFITTVLICAILYYRSFLRKEEHNERYRMQVKMISDLQGEIYFLKNNMEKVEHVMDEAFGLYRSFDKLDDQERKNKALSIAKNVHEVKKNYFRTIEGIDIAITPESNDVLSLKDLMRFLEQSMIGLIDQKGLNVTLAFQTEGDYAIRAHGLLMSVLSNLVVNGIEAIETTGHIDLIHKCVDHNHVFEISDNGKGISDSDLPFLFKPGYSTKYDETTGIANRGIGLSLVEEIVTVYFKGKIHVCSDEKKGTTFKIFMPRQFLEHRGER